MKSIYLIKSIDGQQTWTIAHFSSKKIAVAWKKYFDKHYPENKHIVRKEFLFTWEPDED